MTRLILSLLALVAFLSGCAQGPITQEPARQSGPLTQGQQIFLSHCVSCHQGAGNPPEPNAVIMDSTQLNSETSFKSLIRKPISPMMRAYGPEEISDADVHVLYQYLIGLRTPPRH